MDFDELGMILRGLGVPDSVASIGGYADDHFCLVPVADGTFEVCWFERGAKHDVCVYDSVNTACLGFLGVIGGGLSGLQPVAPGHGVRNALGGASYAHPAVQRLLASDPDTVFGPLPEPEWIRSFVLPEDRGLPIGQRRLIWPDAIRHPDGFTTPAGRAPGRLEIGSVLDSFGPTFTRILYDEGASFGARSLPIDYAQSGYRRWRVLQPTPVWSGAVAPWFGRQGGAIQHKAMTPVIDLVGAGFVEELPL
ncbi:TNT domain-containing protein [Nocardia sp. BMG111209]|uniref:TNT domain-containing protein n=1 Tax=Nocardia sp. BMG111209 TaxID=1160137 RepID=UPI000375367A|nr:TNT domain-containing protein [Nocardia sp. BMG111209]